MRFVLTVVLNAVALWLTTLILPGLHVTAYASDNPQLAIIVTYLLLALVWGVVNSIIGGVVRFVSFPLYCLTLGLFALIVNGFLFWLVAWISGILGFGLTVDNFWWAVGGAVLMGIFSAILNGIFNRRKADREKDHD
ncbi:phage holin family protein [Gulosibacter macacae]|uniref:Phage holin family protein n=1 Tax=Gulosibacter macacae TaxID=2488791 RepID=A0A3P3VUR1_9MICO|nr:phage holin family protein [Gulosibacter macacae]RRJ86551.1 phage holin family protein [Gulosibacter macacae]